MNLVSSINVASDHTPHTHHTRDTMARDIGDSKNAEPMERECHVSVHIAPIHTNDECFSMPRRDRPGRGKRHGFELLLAPDDVSCQRSDPFMERLWKVCSAHPTPSLRH